jgi:hypothetical protein
MGVAIQVNKESGRVIPKTTPPPFEDSRSTTEHIATSQMMEHCMYGL